MKKYLWLGMVCVLLAALLAGCGSTAEQTPEPTLPPIEGIKTVEVSTPDELLKAIGSNTVIYLAPGVYDITEMFDYGARGPYNKNTEWPYVGDGNELVIKNVENLYLVGTSREEVSIVTSPRYANVLCFYDCVNVNLTSLTLGHTDGGQCAGGVVYFDLVDGASIADCELYGCGILGVAAADSRYIFAENCVIRDCSEGAVSAVSSEDLRFNYCEFYGCGGEESGSLFSVIATDGFALVNCEIHDNTGNGLISADLGRNVCLLGSEVRDNSFDYAFSAKPYTLTVDATAFEGNEFSRWSNAPGRMPFELVNIADAEGKPLSESAICSMERQEWVYAIPESMDTSVERVDNNDGTSTVYAATVDELLAAIAPDTTIYLTESVYRFDTASDYGVRRGEYYYWNDNYDGPELVIDGVRNLHIVGMLPDTELQAVPRYANVLHFTNCENISVESLTAGHVEGLGICTGGVIYLENCSGVSIGCCRLYGCGIIGIDAVDVYEMSVKECEIYECSYQGINIFRCGDVDIADCDIHDCGEPNVNVSMSRDVFFDGTELDGCYNYSGGKNGQLELYYYADYEG